MPTNDVHGSLLSARVTSEQIEVALRETIKRLHSEGHVGYAHPTGKPFEYKPSVCPECRLRIIQALAAKELLYV
jgi:hypothetical protein